MTTINETMASRLGDALDCLVSDDPTVPDAPGTIAVDLVRPGGLASYRARLAPPARTFLDTLAFDAEPGSVAPLPAPDGTCLRLACGIGDRAGTEATGGLACLLPAGRWRLDADRLADCGISLHDALLGFCLGADRVRPPGRAPEETSRSARLVAPDGVDGALDGALDAARAIRFGRALVNMPANRLGPSELAAELVALATRFGARSERIEGDALDAAYPAIAAVGAGSERAPVVASLHWGGSGAGEDAPLVSLVGKGVCFDTGGYDLKPSAGMLRMKKDMGGAAVVLAVAALAMARDLPIRLAVRIGCVENSVSGRAMRPSDVIATRRGLSVEINNTDAEGRLVLADLLADAADEKPALLLDVATLTGAARVALGPDLPALFTDDERLAAALLAAGRTTGDPMWRLPLWHAYEPWLKTLPADLSNVSSKPMAGAITAALFLARFVPDGVAWAHLDAYCWNDQAAPARPEGGEVPLVRAIHAMVTNLCENRTMSPADSL